MAKVIVDIPSILINDAKENRNYISVNKLEIVWKAVADGIIIPDDATCGNVIEALFPDFEFREKHGIYSNYFNDIRVKEELWNEHICNYIQEKED